MPAEWDAGFCAAAGFFQRNTHIFNDLFPGTIVAGYLSSHQATSAPNGGRFMAKLPT